MAIEVPVQPDAEARPTTRVRGVKARDIERELAEWRCLAQEAIGDTPVEIDEAVLRELPAPG